MIQLFAGPVGSGKSLHAAESIADYLSDGVQVFSTVEICWAGMLELCAERWGVVPDASQYHYLDPKSLDADLLMLTIGPGESERHSNLLVLDECGILFPVRGWKKNEEQFGKFMAWLAQSRKDHCDVIILVQNAESLDANILRQLAGQWAVYHRSIRDIPFLHFMRMLGNFGHWISRTPHQITMSGRVKSDGLVRGRLYRPTPTVYKAYVTDQRYSNDCALGARVPRQKLPRCKITAGWSGILRQCIPVALCLSIMGIMGCVKAERNALEQARLEYVRMTQDVSRLQVRLASSPAPSHFSPSAPSANFSSPSPSIRSNLLVSVLNISGRWTDEKGRWHFSMNGDEDVFPGYVIDGRVVAFVSEHLVRFIDGGFSFLRVSPRVVANQEVCHEEKHLCPRSATE